MPIRQLKCISHRHYRQVHIGIPDLIITDDYHVALIIIYTDGRLIVILRERSGLYVTSAAYADNLNQLQQRIDHRRVAARTTTTTTTIIIRIRVLQDGEETET